MTNVRDKFLDFLDRTGMSVAEFERRSGVSYDVLNKLKRRNGSSTSAERAAMILATIEEADGHEPTEKAGLSRNVGRTNLVPVYDIQASAGFGALVEYEERTGSLAFPPDYLRILTSSSAQNLAIITVKGDSMEPTLLDDDVVLIDMTKRHIGYEGMFVLRHNDTLLVKRAGMAGQNGRVTLLSDNKIYPPVEAAIEDINVVGKVLWYGRKV